MAFITIAEASDLSAIQQLLTDCHLPFEDLTPTHLPRFWLVKQRLTCIASIGMEEWGNIGLLRSLAVLSPYRDSNLASELVDMAELYAKEQKLTALYLLTTTAVAFFTKRGYQLLKREEFPAILRQTPEFHSLCPATAICMWKTL
ncbi:arsenic resistance N-acetyltransferase ArsN2 [Beggiatoa leptomitoformis]|uniref:GNAT family N-acetyltransferase n=1 Tax=Beggiatoa leptomitoformis TaxID=288004 RepID=A0A2N9Y9Y8_9GAMM|nr:arsenic resistance N-acetyltransferase ArsN2 [Beggiatoa leptomitoformis]ALG67296.1 GNAT family N-acetyltransferase [Beggiatoa leptomitoformis]AUI67272.1 GNAT family N-acetyltransferase [Beggiatoa leptomitoformis]